MYLHIAVGQLEPSNLDPKQTIVKEKEFLTQTKPKRIYYSQIPVVRAIKECNSVRWKPNQMEGVESHKQW